MATYILDHYYLLITLLVTLLFQFSAFIISFLLQFDKITDISASVNFSLLALLTFLLSKTYHTRQIVVTTLTLIWAVRLGSFLLYRVLKAGKDDRFDQMRKSFVKFGGFWTIQFLWVWVVSLPATVGNSPGVGERNGYPKFGSASDIVGIIMWCVGMAVEIAGDLQKTVYKNQNHPRSKINNTGIWGWSRHPNFFGEILLWWGMFILSIRSASISSSAHRAIWSTIASPLFTTLILLFVSGLPTSEKPVQNRYFSLAHENGEMRVWEDYQEYLNSTSIMIPFPPSIYRKLPSWLKRTVLIDFPIFNLSLVEQHRALKEADAKRGTNGSGFRKKA